jgi:hypothetical protein
MVSAVAVPEARHRETASSYSTSAALVEVDRAPQFARMQGDAVRKQTSREEPAFKDNPFSPGDALDEKGVRQSVEWGSAQARDQFADRYV